MLRILAAALCVLEGFQHLKHLLGSFWLALPAALQVGSQLLQ